MFIYIKGKDTFEKEKYYLDYLKSNNIQAVNLTKLTLNKKTQQNLVDVILTPSIFGDKKLIVIENNELEDIPEIIIDAINKSEHHIISFTDIPGANVNSTINFNVTSRKDLVQYVINTFPGFVDYDVAEYLVDFVNEDKRILENELAKIMLFDTTRLTKKIIDENCYFVYEDNIYSIFEDLLNNYDKFVNRIKHIESSEFWLFSYYTRKQILETCSGRVSNYNSYKQKTLSFFKYHYSKEEILQVYDILIQLEYDRQKNTNRNYFMYFYILLKQNNLLSKKNRPKTK